MSSYIRNKSTLLFSVLGLRIIKGVSRFGAFLLFCWETVKHVFRRPYRFELIAQQIEFIGAQSLNIVIMTGFFTGAVFGLQLGGIFKIFSSEAMLGGATGKALTRELAPLMVAFLTAGRSGSAMTAEISTMNVTEQVDAMEAMAVEPLSYLAVPRLVASVIVFPLLTIIFIFIGVIGSYVIAVSLFDVDVGLFLDKIVWLVEPKDIRDGLIKSVIFSVIVAFIACHSGLHATGGAKGVGIATTNAVVTMLLMVLASDFLVTYLQVRW